MRRFTLLALALGALLLLPFCTRDLSSEGDTAAAAENRPLRPAPDFTLQDAEGHDVKLSDYRDKVVLLNFWATWCGPCKIEMPWFVEFQRKYKDRGFTVLAVSLDEEGWEVVKPFAQDMELNFPVVVGSDALADEFGGIMALPTTFIINKEGQITSQHTGLASKRVYEDDIEKLL